MKKIFTGLLLLTAMNMNAQDVAEFKGSYPETKKSGHLDVYFGKELVDDYRWLEDDLADDTKEWVKKQNEVTFDYLGQIPFRDAIKKRLESLWNYEKYSAPFKEGDYTYFYKNDGLQNQYVLYRQLGNGAPEVFLDPNKFSKDGTTSLSGIQFSKDGSLCAFQISEGGSDWRKVIVLDAKSKMMKDDTLVDIKFSGLSWRGNEGFYYSSYDKPVDGSELSGKTQYHKLYFHKLGTSQSQDEMIFGGTENPRRYIGGSVTEDEQYLVISAADATYGNELYIRPLKKDNASIMPIAVGYEYEQDVVYSKDGILYILTNRGAPNRRLVKVNAEAAKPDKWETVIPEGEFPMRVSTCGGKFFVSTIKHAVSEVKQYNLDGTGERKITLPGLGTASGFGGKETEQDLYYSYTSYIYPPTIFKYNIKTGKSQLYKKSGVDFDPSLYESKQVFYTSQPDGAEVPMIITYKKGTQLNGKNPLLLYGYGGFNISLTPHFSVSNTVFMDNGGIYVVANIRGGGEYGDRWHNDGIQMKKQNVFNDFISAAEYLIAEKYTSKEYLAIAGGSNGGLLVGACMTQRPDLFAVCFPAVGVLDMLRYHKFTAGAGWSYDYGTSEDSKEMFEYLLKYSPVQNTRKGTCYPATMITTGDHDDRVVPAHSFKFAAALQNAQSCKHPTLIRIETKAGHGAGKPTSMIIDEQADKWAFLFYNMGLSYNR